MEASPMANVGNVSTMTLRSKAEMKLLLFGLTPTKAHSERVRAYGTLHGLLEHIGTIPNKLQNDLKTLWLIVQQDIVSSNEEIVVQSLRVLGIILRLAKLTDTVASNFLNTLLAIITTTSRKRICVLGLWCISTQELSRPLLVLHLKMILATIIHGIENQRGSVSIIHEAFQALMQVIKQLPREMREYSVSWAPALYHKLLDWKTSELAQKCLLDVQNVLLPPIPELTEAVMTDLQLRLVTKMMSMVKGDEREAVSAMRALSWLIKFLGEKFLQEKRLINEILEIFETSFTSTHTPVRNASQIAWVTIVDAFVPFRENDRPRETPESSRASSRGVHYSRKRLKLLMTPLVTSISWEKVTTSQRICCCTWIYLLCRLGVRVNECLEFDTAVVPMLEAVFKLGPKRADAFVWATCLDVFKSICARNNSCDPSLQNGVQTPELLPDHSPRTPVRQTYEGVLAGAHHQKIQWVSWRLDRLESLLQLFKLLWSHEMAQFDEVPEQHTGLGPTVNIFNAAVGYWRLLVQGVKAEEKNSVRPSGAHIAAVHLLLNFFSSICNSCASQGSLAAAWELAEILIDVLQPVILTSSFYKVQFSLEEIVRLKTQPLADSTPIEQSVMDMATPVVYISAVWFDAILQSEFETKAEDLLLRRVTSLITTGKSGFDVMGTFYGFAWILDCLGKGISSIVENSPGTDIRAMESCSRNKNRGFLLNVWRTVADQLREYVERACDAPLFDPDCKVTWNLLLYPIKFFLCLSLRERHESSGQKYENLAGRASKEAAAVSEAQFLCVESTWFRLYESVSRISSCKPSSSNAFIGGFFNKALKVLKHFLQEETNVHSSPKVSYECLRLLGDVVVHALKSAEVPSFAMLAISRKRRKAGHGASSVRVQCLSGVESEDSSHLRDLLLIASMLLTLSYECYKSGDRYLTDLDVVIRIFGALAGIAQQTTSQSEALRLLKAFSQPFTLWLVIGAEGGSGDDVSRVTLGPLQDALTQAWDGLLSCLQACHPGLTFGSAILDVQAPTLSLALLHTHRPIANRALSFWEATYGSKCYPLKYPSALVEVFCKLRQQKVAVSLPGWSTRVAVVKQKFSDIYSRHPLARFMPQNATRELPSSINISEDSYCKNMVGTNLVTQDPCSSATAGLMKETVRSHRHEDLDSTLQNGSTPDSANENGITDGKHRESGADEVSPRCTSNGQASPEEDGSFEDFMRIVNSALKKIPEQLTNNSSPDHSAVVTTFPYSSRASADDGQASLHPLPEHWTFRSAHVESSTSHENRKSLEKLLESQLVLLSGMDSATDRSAATLSSTSALITPPVTSIDASLSPPKIPPLGERDIYVNAAVATKDPAAQVSNGNPSVSKLPQRRKKLSFHDDVHDAEEGVCQSLLERTTISVLHKDRMEVKDLQKTRLMEEGSVDIGELQNCNPSLNPAADVTEVEASGVSCKENEPPNVPPSLVLVTARSATEQTEAEEPPSICSESDDFSAGSRGRVSNDWDLPQMKEKLATLYMDNPTLSLREIVRSEQFVGLPRPVLRMLTKHLEELKSSIKLDHINSALDGEERAMPDRREQSQYNEDKVRLTEDAVNHTLAHSQGHDRQLVMREDPNATNLQRRDTASPELVEDSDYSVLYRERSCLQITSRRTRSRQVSDVLAPRPNLRSSGKLRGGKHWRIDAETAEAYSMRSGNKKQSAKRRRSLNHNSIPLKEERVESVRLLQKGGYQGDFTAQTKNAHVSTVPREVEKPAVPVSEDYLQCDGDAGFKIRQLHRGMFDASVGATELTGPRSQEDVEMEVDESLERIPRANHGRKCKFPRRVQLSSHCSADHHMEEAGPVVIEEAADAMSGGGSLCLGEKCKTPILATESDEVVPTLDNKLISLAERLAPGRERHPQQEALRIGRQSEQNCENCEKFSNKGISVYHGADRTANGDSQLAELQGIPGSNKGEVCNHFHSPRNPSRDLNSEIDRLLQRENVRVYHLLEALASSPEWVSLKEAEVEEAEKFVSIISSILSQRRGLRKGVSPVFVTPPTHFTSYS